MIIILTTLIIICIVLFWTSIFSLIKSYNLTSIPSTLVGVKWFITMLILNVIFIVFIYTFYNYKTSTLGKQGNQGAIGFSGIKGEACTITFANNKFYASYNKDAGIVNE